MDKLPNASHLSPPILVLVEVPQLDVFNALLFGS